MVNPLVFLQYVAAVAAAAAQAEASTLLLISLAPPPAPEGSQKKSGGGFSFFGGGGGRPGSASETLADSGLTSYCSVKVVDQASEVVAALLQQTQLPPPGCSVDLTEATAQGLGVGDLEEAVLGAYHAAAVEAARAADERERAAAAAEAETKKEEPAVKPAGSGIFAFGRKVRRAGEWLGFIKGVVVALAAGA